MGAAENVGDDQAIIADNYRCELFGCGRSTIEYRRRYRADRRRLSDLCRFVHANGMDEYRGDDIMSDSRIPDSLSIGEFTAQAFKFTHDSRVVAVLDIASGADNLMDRSVADTGGSERHHGLDWALWRREPNTIDIQRAGDRHRDDANPTAVYGFAFIQRDENHSAELSACRREFRRTPVLGFLEGIRTQHAARYWCG